MSNILAENRPSRRAESHRRRGVDGRSPPTEWRAPWCAPQILRFLASLFVVIIAQLWVCENNFCCQPSASCSYQHCSSQRLVPDSGPILRFAVAGSISWQGTSSHYGTTLGISDMRYGFAILDMVSARTQSQAATHCATNGYTMSGIFAPAVQTRVVNFLASLSSSERDDMWFDGTDAGSEGKWRYQYGFWAGFVFYDASLSAAQRCRPPVICY